MKASLYILLAVFTFNLSAASEGDRLNRAQDWPTVDLSEYQTLFIEDVVVTDPEGPSRKNQELVQSVTTRMANYIAFSMREEWFENVKRRSPEQDEQGLILRTHLTQYKPGSATARTLLIGTGSAHLNLEVFLIDAVSGEPLTSFTENRTFAWGGLAGGSRGITLMEENAAKEIAAWIALGKGVAAEDILAAMKNVEEVGPPSVPHGTIYILRPQAMVGAAVRFRVGVNDVSIGESKRKRYYKIYVSPGDHEVWFGSDKKKKKKPVTVEDGGEYYFMAMGMKPMPTKKGENKLKQCKLAREVDLTKLDE